MAARYKELETQKNELVTRYDELETREEELKTRNDKLESNIGILTAQTAQADRQNRLLNAKLGDTQECYENLLGTIHSSRSWRLTAPLRFLSHAFKYASEAIKALSPRAIMQEKLQNKIDDTVEQKVDITVNPSAVDCRLSARIRTAAKIPSGPHGKLLISAVVVTDNAANTLIKCLGSLINSQVQPHEIIIVDNASTDGSASIANTLRPVFQKAGIRLVILSSSTNFGFGKAVNIGVKQSRGGHFLVINPDACLRFDALGYLTAPFLLSGENRIAVTEASHHPFEHPKYYDPCSLSPHWFSGCCFLISKKAFHQIGGFDENIFLYGEDVDLSWRLRLAGYRIVYVARAKVDHNDLTKRNAIELHSTISNFYLRGKYGQNLADSLLFLLSSQSGWRLSKVKNSLRAFHRGRKIGRHFRDGRFDDIIQFGDVDFGYETFRRRGHDVPSLSIQSAGEPKVSVVVRTHNRPKFLKRALLSLSNQTWNNLEVIVVEDKTEFAPGIIKTYFEPLDIKTFHTEGGRTHSLNIGIREYSGDYLMFLDDDDILYNDAIATLCGHALEKRCSFVYGGSLAFHTDNKIDGTLKYSYFQTFDRERLKIVNFIPMGCFLIKRDLANKTGYFDEKIEFLEDWDFLRRANAHERFFFVPKDVLIYTTPSTPMATEKRQSLLDSMYEYVTGKDTGNFKNPCQQTSS